METSAREAPSSVSDVLSDLQSPEEFDTAGSRRRGRWWTWLVRGLLLIAVLGLAAVGFAKLAGNMEAKSSGATLTYPVQQGELLITITEDGNMESASNVDIKCEVAGGSTILWIVEDGQEVKEGEKLVQLESSQLEDQINQQKITYERARATHIQAEKDLAVAKISVQEYLEGSYRQSLQDLEAKITIALENQRSAENALQHTQRMFRKGYVSPLQLETQQFAVERCRLDLDMARTAKDVLERFTKPKTLEDLNSKRDTAEARLNAEKASLDLEEARLKRLETQLQKCTILAPQAGMVVYANESSRHRYGGGSQTSEIKEGAMVRDQQAILRLPDLSKMQVKVTVHESKVDRLRRGMRARIQVQDREFQGTVTSIANQPEPTSYMSAAVKEYATIVKIDGESKDLKPGMTAVAEILVARLNDVLSLPVAVVVEQGGKTYCWVKTPAKMDRRPLVLGLNNDKFIEVKDGVLAGEEVVLNPRAVLAEARQEEGQAEKVDVERKFGTAAPGADADSGPRASPADQKRAPGERGAGQSPDSRSSPGGKSGGKSTMDLMQYDKDGDKRISREEAPERIRESFDRLDTNHDGYLDAAEINAMRSRAGRGGGSGGEDPGGRGAP